MYKVNWDKLFFTNFQYYANSRLLRSKPISRNIKTVSYTHLDVYKRQIQWHSGIHEDNNKRCIRFYIALKRP